MLNLRQRFCKRLFDIVLSSVGIVSLFWLIFIIWIVASFDTKSNGFFFQKRVGLHGKIFKLIKIKTMQDSSEAATTITCSDDSRITSFGAFFRRTKMDEIPQLYNILLGDMSFVGPRPDVPGFADSLEGEDRLILSIRPGVTGPASLKYRNEEVLLSEKTDPESYNNEVIWPDKVRINLNYIRDWSFLTDLKYIKRTIFK